MGTSSEETVWYQYYQPDRTQNHQGDKPPKTHTYCVGLTVHGLGFQTEYEVENKPSTSIHCSLLSHYGCNVIPSGQLTLQLPCLFHSRFLSFLIVNQKTPSPLKFQAFAHSDEKSAGRKAEAEGHCIWSKRKRVVKDGREQKMGFAIILAWRDQRQRRIRSHDQKIEHVELEMSYNNQHLLCIKQTSPSSKQHVSQHPYDANSM